MEQREGVMKVCYSMVKDLKINSSCWSKTEEEGAIEK